MLARENCASALGNHKAGRSAQNGGSRTATLDISTGWVPSAASILRRRHQCGVVHKHGNVRVDIERSRRCFGRNEELDVVTRTRALNVRIGLVKTSRCFGRNEKLDVVTRKRALNVRVGLVSSSRCFGWNEVCACLWWAMSSWSVVMAVKRN
jgi:hypothetical protein